MLSLAHLASVLAKVFLTDLQNLSKMNWKLIFETYRLHEFSLIREDKSQILRY
jgi:hypothetical protein